MAIADKLTKANNGVLALAATLTTNKGTGIATADLNASTGWPQDSVDGPVHFALFKVDNATNKLVTGTLTFWKATLSGNTLSTMQLTGGNNQNYVVGDSALITNTPGMINDLVEALKLQHNPDGSHKNITSTNATITNLTVTNLTVGSQTPSPDWTPLAANVTSVVPLGNRSYQINLDTDVRPTVSLGYRLRTTRTVAAPTQCTSLNGSSQSWSKTGTIAGLATGTTWTFKIKAKLNSYKTQVLAALDDGTTNVLQIYANSSGQIIIGGGTQAAQDLVTSYQSHPLGKWFTVTGSITIGASPTGEITLDDSVIPSFVTNSAATTFTAASTTLYIGRNSGGSFVDGKVSQASIFSAIISAATLRGYSSQTQTGSEPNCVGFWALSGNGNDSSPNANHLTANGGATATNADASWGGLADGTISATFDHCIVMATAVSSVIVQVPEGCTIPTTGGVAAVSYSGIKVPYGFPAQPGKWVLQSIHNTVVTQTSTTSGVWYNVGSIQLSIPIGSWRVSNKETVEISIGANGFTAYKSTLSTANNSQSHSEFTISQYGSNSSTAHQGSSFVTNNLDFSVATIMYALLASNGVGANGLSTQGSTSPSIVRAENAYL